MKTTKNLGLNMPDKDDFVEIDKINENTEKIDEELAKKADASGGDISETVITTTEESADEYPVPAAGDNAKTVLGKVQKFFGDLRNWMTGVCLLGQIVNNCVTDNAKLPLSAAQGKALMDLYNVLNTKGQENSANLEKMTSLYGGTAIPANADMHSYITPGNYFCSQTVNAATLKNCPVNVAFYLKIMSLSSPTSAGAYILQQYIAIDGSTIVFSMYSHLSSKWEAIHKVAFTS